MGSQTRKHIKRVIKEGEAVKTSKNTFFFLLKSFSDKKKVFDMAQKEVLETIEKHFSEFLKSDFYEKMECIQKHKIVVEEVVSDVERDLAGNQDDLTFDQLKEIGKKVKETYLKMIEEAEKEEVSKGEKRKSKPLPFGEVVNLIKKERETRAKERDSLNLNEPPSNKEQQEKQIEGEPRPLVFPSEGAPPRPLQNPLIRAEQFMRGRSSSSGANPPTDFMISPNTSLQKLQEHKQWNTFISKCKINFPSSSFPFPFFEN